MVKIFMEIDNKLVEIAIVETVEAAKAFIELMQNNYCIAKYFYKPVEKKAYAN